MLKWLLLACVAFSASPGIAVFEHRPGVRELARDLRDGSDVQFAQRADRALDAMVRVAEQALLDRGLDAEAEALEVDYRTNAMGYLTAHALLEDLGDHAPYSTWIAEKHDQLEAILGKTIMQLLHLDDLKIFNYGIVVVLNMDKLGGDPIDAAEYQIHFDPFCGVLAYWGTWIACEVATSGSGWWLICAPAGMLAEYAVYNYVAPRYSDRFYARFYPG